jgi:sec-independent protein translocase protein TatB
MLPDIGASELLVIAIVALIVVGPKELPSLLRKLGQMMAKVRNMAAEFRASFDEMARQSELDELRREVDALRRGHAEEMAALHASEAQVSQAFDEIGQEIHAGVRLDQIPVVDPADAMRPAGSPPEPAAPQAEAPPAPKPRKPRAKKAAVEGPKAATVEGAPKPPRKRTAS